jgi:hypothetical protein
VQNIKTVNDQPISQPESSLAFLNLLRPDGPWLLVAIKEEGDKSQIKAKTFSLDQISHVPGWILNLNRDAWNIFYSVNPTRELVNRKPQKIDIAAAEYLFVDIDPRTGEDIGEERARIQKLIASYPRRPTFIIDSGGGFHVLWRLEPSAPIDGDGPQTEQVEGRGLALEAQLGADNCRNVDRLLRLPGTINWPTKKKKKKRREPALCRLMEASDQSYPLEAFEYVPLRPAIQAHLSRRHLKQAATSVEPINSESVTPAELESMLLPDWALAYIRFGDDVQKMNELVAANNWRPGKAPFPSRSEPLLAAVGALVRAGVAAGKIKGILLDPLYGISKSVLEAGADAEKYAERQIAQASASGGGLEPQWVERGRGGRPKGTYSNARAALIAMGISCEKNLFTNRVTVAGHLLGNIGGELTDDAIAVLRQMIIDQFGIDCGLKNVLEAAKELAIENGYDPVKDYLTLAAAKYDGVPRIDTWLSTYLGADDTDLTRAIGRLVLLGAVARAMSPGYKFDYVLVLEGAQGIGKSRAIRILASDTYYTDVSLLGRTQQAQQEGLQGIWIAELSELSGLSRTEIEEVKAFITRQSDRARPAFGHFVEDQKRRCIFIGTTNAREYLLDTTGNRRFWPVHVKGIDFEALTRDKDLLFGEAMLAFNPDMVLALPKDLEDAASTAQEERTLVDPWTDILAEQRGGRYGAEMRVSTAALLKTLKLEERDFTSAIARRVGQIMLALGWEPKKLRIDGRSVRGFRRPASTADLEYPEADTFPRSAPF